MGAIRVLAVDDSVVIRRLVGEAIAGAPGLELAGVAANGLIALARIPQLNPDIVILDVEMPELDGLETLVEIRKSYPKLPVIMFSSLTERGATTTLDALARGASDYATKPTGGGAEGSLAQVKSALLPKIFALCGRTTAAVAAPQPRNQRAAVGSVISAASARIGATIDIVAIGCSTGGPNALAEVVTGLPADLQVPVVVTQHMPKMFTRLLAERLDAQSALEVREAQDGDELLPGTVWIAPGDYHMLIRKDGPNPSLTLNQDPPENGCRPAVDVMLRSVVAAYGAGVLSVILTGMGQDGYRGCETVRERGGTVIAQDEATSVVWGMPGIVARAGLAQRVLPLREVAGGITEAVRSARRSARAANLDSRGHFHAD